MVDAGVLLPSVGFLDLNKAIALLTIEIPGSAPRDCEASASSGASKSVLKELRKDSSS
jgi:hypothetical protein